MTSPALQTKALITNIKEQFSVLSQTNFTRADHRPFEHFRISQASFIANFAQIKATFLEILLFKIVNVPFHFA
jgi:hypothetical protein